MLRRVNYALLLLPDFCLILLGHVLCRCTALNRPLWQSVDALVYYLLFPVLLFFSIATRPVHWGAASGLLAAGVLGSVAGIALVWSLPRWPVLGAHIERRAHAAAAQVAFRFNSYVVLALGSRLPGQDGLLFISMLIGVTVPLLNIAAVWPMARGSGQGFFAQVLRNPLVLATTSALACQALGWQVPAWLAREGERVGQAAIALGLMAAGAGMRVGALAQQRTLSALILGVRHLALPLIALALVWLFGLRGTQALALVVFFAMPTASSCYVLAARMGYGGEYVAGLVTLSTLLGMLSLPLAVLLLGLAGA